MQDNAFERHNDDTLAMFIARSPGERGFARSVKQPITTEIVRSVLPPAERSSLFDETDWSDLEDPLSEIVPDAGLEPTHLQVASRDPDVGPGERYFFLRSDSPPDVAGAIPEPDTWALLIVGFGLCGAAMRMRQRQTMRRSGKMTCR